MLKRFTVVIVFLCGIVPQLRAQIPTPPDILLPNKKEHIYISRDMKEQKPVFEFTGWYGKSGKSKSWFIAKDGSLYARDYRQNNDVLNKYFVHVENIPVEILRKKSLLAETVHKLKWNIVPTGRYISDPSSENYLYYPLDPAREVITLYTKSGYKMKVVGQDKDKARKLYQWMESLQSGNFWSKYDKACKKLRKKNLAL